MEYINKGKNGEIILSYKNEEIHCEFLEMYVVDGEEYAVLLEDGSEEVLLMRFKEGDGKNPESFSEIEDDTVFEKVWNLFEADGED